jgi:hypothetical protein
MQQQKNNKALDMSNTEWQTQAQQLLINWTPQHMDVVLGHSRSGTGMDC